MHLNKQGIAQEQWQRVCDNFYTHARLQILISLFSLCQTYIGSILCAVNPYYVIEGLYDKSVMEMYREKHIGELPPHVFAIANECYYSMWKKGESQCILIRYISIRKSIIEVGTPTSLQLASSLPRWYHYITFLLPLLIFFPIPLSLYLPRGRSREVQGVPHPLWRWPMAF